MRHKTSEGEADELQTRYMDGSSFALKLCNSEQVLVLLSYIRLQHKSWGIIPQS